MKKNYSLTLLCILFFSDAFSQNCAPNGITTNPAAPVNTQRPSMINTFDWTQASFPLNSIYDYNDNDRIRSPFFDTDNSFIGHFYDPIPGPKDFLPGDDGWELIKKNFGYEVGGFAVNNPFFILYNKYRGLLRVFVARGDQEFLNGAMFVVRFVYPYAPIQTSLLDHSAELKALNAPFQRDPELNSSSNILNGYGEWFYADFPMNYDPCTCLYQSKLEIRVDLSNTAIISLSGSSSGEIVAQGAPSDSQSGKGSFSLGDVATGAKKIHETYKGIDGWANDLKSKPNANAGSIDNLKNEAKKSNFLKAGLGALPWIGSAIGLVDFFIGGGRKTPGPQLVSVTPMSISMTSTYSGTISTDYPYSPYVSFRTPGSDPGTAPDTEYPYYNEVLGILNILKTPVVNYQYGIAPFGTGP